MNRLLSPQPVVYRGTVTGLRISAVDGGATESGGAFVDNLPQAILDLIALYPGVLQFDAYDANNRFVRGVLKVEGSAEGLGDEKLSTWVNGDVSPFETFTGGAGSSITQAINTAAAEGWATASQSCVIITNGLYKGVATLTFASGAIVGWGIGQNKGVAVYSFGTTTTTGAYRTCINYDYATLAANVPCDFALSNNSLKQVLAPSTAGAVITSLKNGTVYNFSYKNASFAFNEASYYCIVRKLRG